MSYAKGFKNNTFGRQRKQKSKNPKITFYPRKFSSSKNQSPPNMDYDAHGELWIPLLFFFVVYQVHKFTWTLKSSKTTADVIQEFLAAFCGSFLIMMRTTWVSYFFNTQAAYIIFTGTMIQCVFCNTSFLGSGNPLSLYFTEYVRLVNQNERGDRFWAIKSLINPFSIIKRIFPMAVVHCLGQLLGILCSQSIVFFYSPLSKHQTLYADSFNFSTSVAEGLTAHGATFYETMAIFLILLSSTTIEKVSTYCQIPEQYKGKFVLLTESAIVALLVLWTVDSTGAQLNPALAFGMNFSGIWHSGNIAFESLRHLIIFWLYPTIATHIYAYLYVINFQHRAIKKQIKHDKMVKRIHKACLNYPAWKRLNNPGHKPWLYPEQVTAKRIVIADCVQSSRETSGDSTPTEDESSLSETDLTSTLDKLSVE